MRTLLTPAPSFIASVLALVCIGSAFSIAQAPPSTQSPTPSDAQKPSIEWLLSVRCSSCHNESEKKGGLDVTTEQSLLNTGGDSGAAMVPGNLEESLVWQRIQSGEMPPKKPLDQTEQEVFRQWIAGEAKWPGGRIDPARYTSDSRAGYDWWALQPLRVETPPTQQQDTHPIDAFILDKQSSMGLVSSPKANRRILARRIAIDLIGLPPSIAEVVELEKDLSPDAVEKWIDRCLDNPGYGQRWARHWLDAIRFGESHGFERDQLRTNSWRYRDWVVQALNQDMPYDEFCRLQIAGDAYPDKKGQGIVATGMLVAGSYDQVGQTQQSAAMRAVVRQDELEDYVSVIGQTYLGLTVNCSRCHDHKFDPITQREYYELCATLAGTHHGERETDAVVVADTLATTLPRIDSRIKNLEQQIEKIVGPIREQLEAAKKQVASKTNPPTPLARWEFNDLRDEQGVLPLELHENAKIWDGRLVIAGLGHASSVKLKQPLKEKTLEAWIKLNGLQQQGGAAISVESVGGDRFDAIVYAELESRQWMAGSNGFVRTDSFQAPDKESSADWIHMAMVYDSDGTIRAYRNGKPYGRSIRKSDLITYDADAAHVLFGLRHSPVARGKVLECELDRASLYDRALTESEIAASAGSQSIRVSDDEVARELDLAANEQIKRWRFEVHQLHDQKRRLHDAKVYSVVSSEPQKTFVLDRGNPGSPRQEVLPGGVKAIQGVDSNFHLDATANDADRRRRLADWITDSKNPLFARVIVNRVWQFHFGVGIVDTPNDFGFNGGRPTHPELLDWLANDLIQHGWSLKHLHRRIMSSKTYQQSSRAIAENMAKDASNRMLWRMSPARLDAESMRDTMLDLAGKLDRSLDGPGIYDFTLYINNSHFYSMQDPIGDTFQRRTLYRTWVRSARSNLLDVFDCPDPSTKTPQRASTTTPLQSLSLLNNSFVLRIADEWALRAKECGGTTFESQVGYLFEQAFYRKPTAQERQACVEMAEKHGLSSVCRVLLNSNELLYVD